MRLNTFCVDLGLYMKVYLLCVAIELGQNVEQRNLGDDQLLLLILVQWSCRKVKGQK